jgi:hypothetical protein
MQCWLACKELISRPRNPQQRSSSRKTFQQVCQKSIRISPLERACSLVSDDVLEKVLAPGCAGVGGYGHTTSSASLGGISSLPGRIYGTYTAMKRVYPTICIYIRRIYRITYTYVLYVGTSLVMWLKSARNVALPSLATSWTRPLSTLIASRQRQLGDHALPQRGFGLSTHEGAPGGRRWGTAGQHGTRAATREGPSSCVPDQQTHVHQQKCSTGAILQVGQCRAWGQNLAG